MQKHIQSSVYILIILLFTACEKIELGKEITVKTGVTYTITEDLSFTIDSLSDYRCPTGAECIWQGDVSLYIDIDHNENSQQTITLWNSSGQTNPLQVDNYTIHILDVKPYPEIGKEVDPKDVAIIIIVYMN